jgi:hypothetical protein
VDRLQLEHRCTVVTRLVGVLERCDRALLRNRVDRALVDDLAGGDAVHADVAAIAAILQMLESLEPTA